MQINRWKATQKSFVPTNLLPEARGPVKFTEKQPLGGKLLCLVNPVVYPPMVSRWSKNGGHGRVSLTANRKTLAASMGLGKMARAAARG